MYQTLAVSPRNPWICAVLLLIDESGGGTAIQPIGKTPLLIVLRKPRAAIHAQAQPPLTAYLPYSRKVDLRTGNRILY